MGTSPVQRQLEVSLGACDVGDLLRRWWLGHEVFPQDGARVGGDIIAANLVADLRKHIRG